MIRRVLIAGLLASLCVGAAASADTISVTNTNPLQGTYSLLVNHDRTTQAYVQDDSPNGETTFSASWLVRIASAGYQGAGAYWRQSMFQALGPRPAGGLGNCSTFPAGGVISSLRCSVVGKPPLGVDSGVTCVVKDNQCNDRGAGVISIDKDTTYRVCVEWKTGSALSGFVAYAVVGAAESCPSSGSPSYRKVTASNHQSRVDTVRFGAPQVINPPGPRTATWRLDDYTSFRVLNP